MCSSSVATPRSGVVRKSAYIAITIPGVQKPHCEPCISVIRSCTGWSPLRVEPIPSIVVTAHQSTAQSGKRHALTAAWRGAPAAASKLETTTVHAPHPPSPQPSFVPVRPIERSHSSSVMLRSAAAISCFVPLTQVVREVR